MANEKNAGGIVYKISAEVEPLLQAGKQAIDALDKLDTAAQQSGKGLDNLDQSTSNTGSAFTELAGYANSMDNQLKKLNTNVTGIARAMEEARSGTGGASNEFSRAESIIEALGNQLAVLDEAQENGARSAAVLAAQLRAGSKATDEEKQKIGDLTGRLYDMKTGVDNGTKSHGNWKSSMQQAGYQVQDFIIQVQGGQSALVAFAQQGSQLAGAFGPGGAVLGSVIALGSVLAGVLITSLNGGKNAMEALTEAADAMDKVITISQNGIAALSDKYANLARVNATAATLLRNQALIEYNQAISKIPKAISDAADSFISFGDKAVSALGGGYATVEGFNNRLSSLNITTGNYSDAMKQAYGAGQAFSATANSIGNTVGALASKLGIGEQEAFSLTKQLSDLSENPSPQALQQLALKIGDVIKASKSVSPELAKLYEQVVKLSTSASQAAFNFETLKQSTDNLTAGQKNLIRQSERNLALSKLQGEARAKLQAQYAAEDAGFSKDDPHIKQMENDAAATYRNAEAQRNLKTAHSKALSAATKSANQQETVAQKLENLRQQSEMVADSTAGMSREQAILNAQQSLGKGATQAQIAQAGQYAAKKWDTANAIKAQAAAEKLLPEARANASYTQDMQDLNTALSAKKITQEQYNKTSEQLEQQHQANLAKIRAQAVVSPAQEAVAQVDPVQQLANQHAQELALIQQFETQKGQLTQRGLELMNAANTQYEQARLAAQWQIWSQQNSTNQMLASSLDALGNNASNTLASIITGTESAGDAMRSLASSVVNQLINSFVQMGVDWAKSAIMGAATQQSAIAATLAVQNAAVATQVGVSTAAAATTTAAWTPAALMASIASMGTAAKIGLGALLGVAAMGIAGGRKNGGPVSAGNIYPVGEGDNPEFVQTGKGLFMIPGDNGRVFSNSDVTGGSPSIKKASTGSEYLSSNSSNAPQAKNSSQGITQVNIQFFDQASGGNRTMQAETSMNNGIAEVRAYLLDDQANNGEITQGYAAAMGQRVVARGAY